MKIIQTKVFWLITDGQFNFVLDYVHNPTAGYLSMVLDPLSAKKFASENEASIFLAEIVERQPDNSDLRVKKIGVVIAELE